MKIWKISHGKHHFTNDEFDLLKERCLVSVHPTTKSKGQTSISQGDAFMNAAKGDLFYLCVSNERIELLGAFCDDLTTISIIQDHDDWIDRSYTLILNAVDGENYDKNLDKWWMPRNNSTFVEVTDLPLFETEVLDPVFNISLKKLYDKVKEKTRNETQVELLRNSKNIIFTGAPGTGKTFLAKVIANAMNAENEFVQFHPSYDYTDFVEGLRPIKKEGQSELGFELRNGIFKTFCKTAKENPNKDYVFIIDEINRAEISKVFGELFFCIDPGYRGEKGKVKTKFDNLQTEDTYFTSLENDSFYIPDNVYIIGTMNDIDRSVEPFDFAMRRRFTFVEITAEETAESILEGLDQKVELIARLKRLNKAIDGIEGLNTSYHIGAAYFRKIENYKNKESVEQFNKLWSYHLLPLLTEYLRGYSDQKENVGKLKHAYDGK